MSKEEFVEYCLHYAEDIFVREEINGKWGSYSLAELDKETRNKWIEGWWNENRMPFKIDISKKND